MKAGHVILRTDLLNTILLSGVDAAIAFFVCSPPKQNKVMDDAKRWYGEVRFGMVWCGMVSCGIRWYGMVWYGMVLYGVVWYGMVQLLWYGMQHTKLRKNLAIWWHLRW